MTSCIVVTCCLLVMTFTVTSATHLLIGEEPYARTARGSAPNACTDEKDNTNIEIGCRAYTRCQGGQATHVECENGQVYNSQKGACDDINNVKPPCGQWKNCTALAAGRYPDEDNNCRSYYSCSGGKFLGHNFCPASLVFNKEKDICDHESETKAPCGTAK